MANPKLREPLFLTCLKLRLDANAVHGWSDAYIDLLANTDYEYLRKKEVRGIIKNDATLLLFMGLAIYLSIAGIMVKSTLFVVIPIILLLVLHMFVNLIYLPVGIVETKVDYKRLNIEEARPVSSRGLKPSKNMPIIRSYTYILENGYNAMDYNVRVLAVDSDYPVGDTVYAFYKNSREFYILNSVHN